MYRRKKCRASNKKKPQATRMYSQVHDITVASLLFASQKMAAQNPAARERVSRAVMDCSSARPSKRQYHAMRLGLPPIGSSTSRFVPCFSLTYLATSWPDRKSTRLNSSHL